MAAFLLGGIVVGILKPWGWGGGTVAVAPSPTALPSASTAPGRGPSEGGFHGLAYDPAIFGLHEPAANWAIWPAGYLVTFGFVIQLSGLESPAPSAGARATPSSSPSSPAPSDGPLWPERFEVPEGNHLFLVGIDMPGGYSLARRELLRLGPDGTFSTIPLAEMPSPWPTHFVVLGITDANGSLVVWERGVYRLQLTFEPGGLSRPIEIHIGDQTTA